MEDIRISLSAEGPNNEISIVRVDGVIDTTTSTELEKVMNSLVDQKRHSIIVDLGGVDYISSAGWGIFISNIREIRLNKGDIKLVRMIPEVYEVFELLEFDTILKAYDSLEEAKKDFGMEPIFKMEEAEEIKEEFERKRAEASAQKEAKTKEIREMSDEEIILKVVKETPLVGISGIRKEVKSLDEARSLGWWGTRKILKAQGLKSKKRRLRFSRKERFIQRYKG